MKVGQMILYKDGASFKPLKNRKVTVCRRKGAENVFIQFVMADVPKEKMDKKVCNTTIKRGVSYTTLALSKEAAVGLVKTLCQLIYNDEELRNILMDDSTQTTL